MGIITLPCFARSISILDKAQAIGLFSTYGAERKNMSKAKIKELTAREILDSRGNPTVEAKVILDDGSVGCASVPSGASVGKFEAHELRDMDMNRYFGQGVLGAVGAVNVSIAERIIGMEADEQRKIDQALIELDGTDNKDTLGSNATLAVSLAVSRAAARHHGLELYEYLGGKRAQAMPIPMMNVINGGVHASNNIDIQEFMILPVGAENATRGITMSVEIYKILQKALISRSLSVAVGDEGGFAPSLASDEEALRLLCEAISRSGYEDKVKLAIDVASSGWHSGGEYRTPKGERVYSSEELIDYYQGLISRYPIVSIEDGLGEEDYEGWRMLTDRLGGEVALVGDDLFVTNYKRLSMGIELGIANSILIKPNQIGTLSETLDVIKLAEQNGYGHIISHRSGETTDDYIVDLAVATGARYIKAGAPARGERVAKYNRLMEIADRIMKG